MSAHRPGIEEGVRGGVDERETRAQPSPAPLFNSSLFASHTMEPVATLRLPDARLLSALLRSIRDPGVPHQVCEGVPPPRGGVRAREKEEEGIGVRALLP